MAEIKLYTLTEVSEITNASKTTLYRYIKEGKLQAVKIAKKWAVSEANLQTFIDGKAAEQPGTKAGKNPRRRKPRV